MSPRQTGLSIVPGFLTAGMHAGIKEKRELDLALIVSEHDTSAAGVFTTNRCAAAPVTLTKRHIRTGNIRAIITNSGNANACTGVNGMSDARDMAKATAEALGLQANQICVSSTGIIGKPLPMERIRAAIPGLVTRLKPAGGRSAARAILTTDVHVKETGATARIAGKTLTIGGIAKGAGMIHPNMATMLGYLATDALIETSALQRALKSAVDASFNAITIDGETSTNDMVLCLANGHARNSIIKAGTSSMDEFQRFLTDGCVDLAKQIVRDGEGTTKVIQVIVQHAKTSRNAKTIAEAIGTSPLVKTAMFGQDPNWGRFMAVIGRARVPIKPALISILFDDVAVVEAGMGTGVESERSAKTVLRRQEFPITLDLGIGHESHRIWTTDLSPAYVALNAHYPT